MDWLARLFRPHVELAPELTQRVRAWRALPVVDGRMPLAQARFIVVDVETSGLKPRRDRLLSIGAVVVEQGHLFPADGFDVVLKNNEHSRRDNILIHGLGPQAQAAGIEPEAALIEFLEYVGKCLLVAFHAAFDHTVLDRNLRETLGVRLLNPWLDLAQLAPALVPEARLAHAGLDDWLSCFSLQARVRHRASDDAFATAELFLILLARARARGIATTSALHALCDQQARSVLSHGIGGA